MEEVTPLMLGFRMELCDFDPLPFVSFGAFFFCGKDVSVLSQGLAPYGDTVLKIPEYPHCCLHTDQGKTYPVQSSFPELSLISPFLDIPQGWNNMSFHPVPT